MSFFELDVTTHNVNSEIIRHRMRFET
ncbi:MAG: hypothetical protein ACI88H_002446, partial [Cocleimonas sp.]